MTERLLRARRRFIMVESSAHVSPEAVSEAVRDVFEKLYGRVGLSDSGFRSMMFDGRLVLSCYKEWLPRLVLAVSLVRRVKGVDAVVRTVRISGTVRGLRRSGVQARDHA
ncbi:MAG: Rpp14/Pop5 family protein [Candidatus Caldarchaeum sp.]|nr:Rpp14/Pop5 family protein [Candidatus Caldarchaeum sp.]